MKLISNLSDTILCPYQLFIDIHQQLDQINTNVEFMVFQPICELNSTNDWINLEAFGQPTAIRAKELNTQLTQILKMRGINEVELHIYLNHKTYISDNVYALIYLAESLKSLTLHFYCTNTETIKKTINGLRNNSNINIQYFDADQFFIIDQHQETIDKLNKNKEQLLQGFGFQPLPEIFKTRKVSQSIFFMLIGYAWTCLKTGAYDPACNMIDKILSDFQLSEEQYELIFMHQQLIRFLSHQYNKVTKEAFPNEFKHLQQEDINSLYFIKAYAATMCRDLEVADACFKRCHVHEDMELTDVDSLYRLNLFALSQVLKGKLNIAFNLENRIEDFIKQHHIEVTGLKYVNCINIARLYKKSQDFKHSQLYYDKAYQEIRGGYTESDHIYYHINYGSLYESARQMDKALFHWIKAAIHWLAYDNKYALAWRPRIILCQEKLNDILSPLSIQYASQYLYDKIQFLLKENQISLTTIGHQLHFITDKNNPKKDNSYLLENIVLFDTKEEHTSSPTYGDETTIKLALLISDFIINKMKFNLSKSTVIVSTCIEDGVGLKQKELQKIAEAFSFLQTAYQQNTKDTDIAEPMIETIENTEKGLKIICKRSFLTQTISNTKVIKLITQLRKKQTLFLSAIFPEITFELIHQLMVQKLITLTLSTLSSKNPGKEIEDKQLQPQ